MDKYSHIKIADRIMQKACEAGITSERALCLQAGVNPNFVRAIRIGKTRSPRGDSLQKVASLLKVSVDWILTEHGDNAPVISDTNTPSGVAGGQQIAARVLQRGCELGYKSERAICLAAGVGVDFLRHLRIGKTRTPKADNLARLADFLGVSMEWLVTGSRNGVTIVEAVGEGDNVLSEEMYSPDEPEYYKIFSSRLASLERAIFEIASQGNFHVTALSSAAASQGDNDLEICRKNMISAMHASGLNPNLWAALAGVSESGVRGFLNGDAPNISLGFLSKLAAVLGFRAVDFLRSNSGPDDWNRVDRLPGK